jgi:hypothetical protein
MISFRDFTICFSTCKGFSLTVRLYHKVESTYIPRVHITVYVPSLELRLPHPLCRKQVCPPPGTKGGEAHSPAGEVAGSPNSDDLRKSLALCLLCRLYRRTITNPVPDIISPHTSFDNRCDIHTRLDLKMMLPSVMGKHPDLMVGPPTPTIFPTNDRNFERSQFFEKIFEKI